MEPRIVELQPKKLIGLHLKMSLAQNRTKELWQGFGPRRKEITNNIGPGAYSLQVYEAGSSMSSFNYNTEFEKWAVVEVEDFDSVPDGMDTYTLEGGLYAVFIHKGPVTTFHKTSAFIHTAWFPNSEYVRDERESFEYLDERYLGPMHPDSEEEVWVPIRPKE